MSKSLINVEKATDISLEREKKKKKQNKKTKKQTNKKGKLKDNDVSKNSNSANFIIRRSKGPNSKLSCW